MPGLWKSIIGGKWRNWKGNLLVRILLVMGLLVLVEQEGVGRGLMQKNWIEGWMIWCQVPGTSTLVY
jgi:hypothetical protein